MIAVILFGRGAKEALVVAYDHKEHYHGLDGFNDVVFPDSPDMSRIKGTFTVHFVNHPRPQSLTSCDVISLCLIENQDQIS